MKKLVFAIIASALIAVLAGCSGGIRAGTFEWPDFGISFAAPDGWNVEQTGGIDGATLKVYGDEYGMRDSVTMYLDVSAADAEQSNSALADFIKENHPGTANDVIAFEEHNGIPMAMVDVYEVENVTKCIAFYNQDGEMVEADVRYSRGDEKVFRDYADSFADSIALIPVVRN